jgi:hypothetical protein
MKAGRNFPTLLGILTCLLLAAALSWWLAQKAIDVF